MTKSSKNAVAIALFLVALLFGIWVADASTAAWRAAHESMQHGLLAEATQLLREYHREHGEYPVSLEGLAFTYPDGGNASLLSEFKYESDGKSFSLTTVGASTGEALKVTGDDQ